MLNAFPVTFLLWAPQVVFCALLLHIFTTIVLISVIKFRFFMLSCLSIELHGTKMNVRVMQSMKYGEFFFLKDGFCGLHWWKNYGVASTSWFYFAIRCGWADESISLCAGPLLIASWQYCKGNVFPSFGGTMPDVKPFRLPQWIAVMRIGSSIAWSKRRADEWLYETKFMKINKKQCFFPSKLNVVKFGKYL